MQINIKDIKIGKRIRNELQKIEELAESIKENGLIVPIVIDKNNRLVDGERRIKAHKLLKKKEISFTRYPEHTIEAEASANTGIHWNIIESVAIWNAMEKSKNQYDKDATSDSDGALPRQRAAKITNYSHDTLSKAKYILDSDKQERIEELKTGKSVNKIYNQLKAEEEIEEDKKAEEESVEEEEATETEEEENEEPEQNEQSEETTEEEEEQEQEPEAEEPEEEPFKKYKVIYADPPWKYNRNVGEGIAGEEYSLMGLEKIKKYLETEKIQPEDNSLLFLWITFPLLKEGIEVLESWGFKYKTCGFNWIKLNKNKKPFFGIGHYTKSNSELCLIGIKGKGLTILDDTISQIVMTEKSKHSKKPDEIPDLIVRLVGDRKRAELFARKKRKGWDTYGNEIKGDKNDNKTTS